MNDTMEKKKRICPSISFKVDNRLWKEIWSIEVSNKIRNFIWRLCTNSIAINANMLQKKVRSNPLYFICLKELEIVEHLCFLYEWTVPIWFVGCLGLRFIMM